MTKKIQKQALIDLLFQSVSNPHVISQSVKSAFDVWISAYHGVEFISLWIARVVYVTQEGYGINYKDIVNRKRQPVIVAVRLASEPRTRIEELRIEAFNSPFLKTDLAQQARDEGDRETYKKHADSFFKEQFSGYREPSYVNMVTA